MRDVTTISHFVYPDISGASNPVALEHTRGRAKKLDGANFLPGKRHSSPNFLPLVKSCQRSIVAQGYAPETETAMSLSPRMFRALPKREGGKKRTKKKTEMAETRRVQEMTRYAFPTDAATDHPIAGGASCVECHYLLAPASARVLDDDGSAV